MAFSISVHRRVDDVLFSSPPPVGSPEFDGWFRECEARTLLFEPLGSDGTVYRFWHLPAIGLGLPLISAIYNDGLEVSGGTVKSLAHEADVLEEHWNRLDLGTEPPLPLIERAADGSALRHALTMKEHLAERLAYLRRAITLARSEDGIITVG